MDGQLLQKKDCTKVVEVAYPEATALATVSTSRQSPFAQIGAGNERMRMLFFSWIPSLGSI